MGRIDTHHFDTIHHGSGDYRMVKLLHPSRQPHIVPMPTDRQEKRLSRAQAKAAIKERQRELFNTVAHLTK